MTHNTFSRDFPQSTAVEASENNFFPHQRDSIMKSTYCPEKNKTIEKIEITEYQEKKGYIQYRILTSLSSVAPMNTYRRYSEFEKLHIYLRVILVPHRPELNNYVLPRLPEKHGLQDHLLEYDEEGRKSFWNERREDLEIYLNLLIEDSFIRDDQVLKEFLSDTSLEKLSRSLEVANILIPASTSEKALAVVKNAWGNVRKTWEYFNATTAQSKIVIPTTLSAKLEKVKSIKLLMDDLLANERLRVKTVYNLSKEIDQLFSGPAENSVIASLVGKKVSKSERPVLSMGTFELRKIESSFQDTLRDQIHNLDKTADMKKKIKILLARCEAIIEGFNEINSKAQSNGTVDLKRLEEAVGCFEQSVDAEDLLKKTGKLLDSYASYYSIINSVPS